MAKVAAPVDDEELRILLIGDDADQQRAFQAIDAQWREATCAHLRRRFPGLPSADLPDIWQDTMVNLLLKVLQGEFDIDQPLKPFVWSLAFARATDRLRRLTVSTRDDVLQAVALDLSSPAPAAINSVERAEIREFIRDYTTTLPYKQRVVLQAFVDGYPDTAATDILRRSVSEITGEAETAASVKRPLQEARRKAATFLEQKARERKAP